MLVIHPTHKIICALIRPMSARRSPENEKLARLVAALTNHTMPRWSPAYMESTRSNTMQRYRNMPSVPTTVARLNYQKYRTMPSAPTTQAYIPRQNNQVRERQRQIERLSGRSMVSFPRNARSWDARFRNWQAQYRAALMARRRRH